MTPHEIGELVSLSLTSPAVISGLVVVIKFWKPALHALFTKKTRTPAQWLILGIAVSFIGGVIDNSWWGSAWGRLFMNDPSWHWWFFNGVFSNIPFRQIASIVAASCHIKSVWATKGEVNGALKMNLFNAAMIAITLGSFVFWLWVRP